MTDPLLFALGVVIVLATPGPTNTLLMTSGATVGIHRSLSLLLAEVCGYVISIVIVAAAISPALSSINYARAALGVVVGLYLCVLAARLWRKRIAVGTRLVLWHQVFVTTLLNPKVLVFVLVVIPVNSPDSTRYLTAFAAIVPTIGALWIVLGATAGGLVPDHRFEVIPKVGAAVLASFAFVLIVSSVQELMGYAGLRATYSENMPKTTLRSGDANPARTSDARTASGRTQASIVSQ